MSARDYWDNLRCQVPGCKSVIRAMTGLQEIHKLITHMRRVHATTWDVTQALEWRARWEKDNP